MTQQLDEFGDPLAGGFLYLIQAGTVSTPQNGFQDSALTLPWPNPIVLSASGRIPQFFLADGSIKIRLTDVNGVEILVADGLIVTGASSGGGGGSPVDPTTVLQTGWIQPIYGTGVVTGFVRANGRTMGSATSGATERANADTLALYSFLYGQDPNLAVSGGRGVSAAVDFAANKTIALPDCRDVALAGLDDMGNSSRGGFAGVTFSIGNATTLGSVLGQARRTLLLANLPAYTPTGTITNGAITIGGATGLRNVSGDNNNSGGGGGPFSAMSSNPPTLTGSQASSTFAGAQVGASAAFDTISPYLLVTLYLKL